MTSLPLPASPLTFTRQENLYARVARLKSRVVMLLCCAAALLTLGALFSIFGYIIYQGAMSIHLSLFRLDPTSPDQVGGMRTCIVGTVILIAMASAIGLPLGMLTGIYLAEYAPSNTLHTGLRIIIDVLASVPSFIVGVIGYELVVVPMGTPSAYAGAVALAFIMTPIIARTTEDMLKLVPKSLREASIGLGGSRFQTLTRVILPAAKGGIITGVMLAVARVAGETAPLMFTILGYDSPVWSFDRTFPWVHLALRNPFPSLTLEIFKYATSSEPEWIKEAWAGMLVLITLITVLNLAVRFTTRKRA